MAYDGSIRINTRIDGKGFNTGVKSMMSSLGSLATALGVTFGVAAIVNFAKTSVETSMQMEAGWQGLRYMANAYGRDIKQIETFLQDYTADGLVPMMNAQAAYKNMLARGYDTEQLEAMLLVMKDSSVYLRKGQLDIGQAIENTTMGLRTERSILTDSSGIEQNMYKMWQAYAKEQGTTISALTKQQKIIAEFQGFMKEGAIYAGAAAAYTETYAGRVAQLTASMIGLKVSVGNMITPLLNALLPAIIKLVNWFTVLFNVAGRVMNLLFGSNVGAVDLENAAAAAGELAGNTEAAGEAAKGALAAFDKINVLKQPEAAIGTEEPGPGEEVPDPTKGVGAAIDELAAKVAKFKADLIAFFEPMKEPFARLKEAFTTLGTTLSTILSPLWEEVLKPFIGWIGQEVAPRVIELLAIALENLKIIIEANKPLLTDIWEKTLKPILTWTGDTITDILDWLIVKLTDFGIWAKDNPETIRTITTVLLGFFLAWKTANLAVTIAGVVTKMVDFVWQLGLMAINLGIETAAWIANTAARIANNGWVAIGIIAAGDYIAKIIGTATFLATETLAWITSTASKIANTIATTAQTVATWLWNAAASVAAFATTAFGVAMSILTSPITLVVVAIVALIAIVYLLITHWDDVKKFAIGAWEKIKEVWGKVAEWFDKSVLQPVKKWFEQAWIDIKGWVTQAWTDIQTWWGGAGDWFNDSVITPIKNWFSQAWIDIKGFSTSAWENIKLAWQGAKDWFEMTVITPVKSFFETAWETIKLKVTGVWTAITTAWGGAKAWFDSVVNSIKTWFDTQWDAISAKVTGVWTSITSGTAWGNAKTWFEGVNNGIKDWFGTQWDAISSKVTGVWTAVKSGTAWGEAKTWFEGVNNGIKDWFGTQWDAVSSKVTSVWTAIKANETWGGAATWFDNNVLATIKSAFSLNWNTISSTVTGVWNSITSGTAWGNASSWFWSSVIWPIKDYFTGQWDLISGKITGVWETVKGAWGNASSWFWSNVIWPIKDYFTGQWDLISSKITSVWTAITTAWSGASSWFWSTVIWPIKDYFTGQWDLISSKITGVWDTVKSAWNGAVSWFQTSIINPIVGAFDLGWSTISGFISGAFTNLSDPIKGVINNVIGFLNGLLFGLVDLINGVVNLINSVSIDVPDWVASTFGIPDPFGFSLNAVGYPAGIPYLATGAVIPANAPFAVVLGDQRHGTNIEAPENLIRKIIREEMGGSSINETFEVRVPVYLDSQKIYEGQERVRRQRGRSLFAGGFAG